MFKLLEGPQTLGRGKIFWSCFLAVLAGALTYPLFADSYDVGNFAYFLIWIFMALGLCLMWGYGGMLSFGQTLFFGIAGYGYGVLAINMGGGTATIAALALSVVIAMVAAGILGYFMIWGGINGIFFGIVTLSATLVLAFFLGQTAGPEWHIGPARLNGFNGMKGMDPLAVGDFYIEGSALYYVMIALIVIVYLALRMLVNSGIGNVIVATRENPQRAEMLGYDVRKYQLLTFVIGSGLAGLSGALYTSWGQFITPSSIGLPAAAMPIVWVAFSGRSDLTATLVGSFLLLFGFQTITVYSQQAALVLMGALLLATVMLAPQGFVLGIGKLAGDWWSGRRRRDDSRVMAEVNAGEVHCLIGPNGAGKSTLFKLIVGLYPPSQGSILFDTVDITKERPYARVQRGMSIKMQAPSVFKELPVRQNIQIALQERLSGAERIAEEDRLLTLLNLGPDSDKLAGALSHGQQQWLEIGMALALKPQLLLLDEPTAGMSPEETFKTGELIKSFNAEGMTVLVVEHDMAFVRQVAQRVTVLHLGKIFARGDLESILQDAKVAEIYLGKTHAH
jgi:urea transport system permease protein